MWRDIECKSILVKVSPGKRAKLSGKHVYAFFTELLAFGGNVLMLFALNICGLKIFVFCCWDLQSSIFAPIDMFVIVYNLVGDIH